MKLPVIKTIDKAILNRQEAVPKWMDAFLETLNPFIESVGLALQNRLTFVENFLGREIELDFVHAVEKEINPKIGVNASLRVRGVLYLTTGESYVEGFRWRYLANGNIGVTFKFSSADTEKIRIQLLMG